MSFVWILLGGKIERNKMDKRQQTDYQSKINKNINNNICIYIEPLNIYLEFSVTLGLTELQLVAGATIKVVSS